MFACIGLAYKTVYRELVDDGVWERITSDVGYSMLLAGEVVASLFLIGSCSSQRRSAYTISNSSTHDVTVFSPATLNHYRMISRC